MSRLVGAVAVTALLLQGPSIVSDRSRSDAVVLRCLSRATRPTSPPRDAEVHAAADPRNPDHLVAAWQQVGADSGVIQASASFDGGRKWSPPRAVPISACAGGPSRARYASDSWVTIGPDGTVFVAAIGFNPGASRDDFGALVVARSDDGGRSWSSGVAAAVADSGVSFDNVSILADPRRSGTVYLTTTRYANVTDSAGASRLAGPIAFTKTTDGGRTWSPLVVISPARPGGRVSAPQLVIDPNDGTLGIVYYRSDRSHRLFGWMASPDGGDTWGAERQIAPAVRAAFEIDSVAGRSFILAGDIVSAAVDPGDGAIYLAVPDGRRDPGGRLGISLIASFDKGGTWTAPLSISPDGPETGWLPAVAVGPDGHLAVAYLTADFSTKASAGVRYHLREVRRTGDQLVPAIGRVLDTRPVAWPGDYHALVPVRRGMRLLTVRGNPDPAHPTDVVSY